METEETKVKLDNIDFMTLCLNLSHDVMHDYNFGNTMNDRIYKNLFVIRNVLPNNLWDEQDKTNTMIINKPYNPKNDNPIKLLTNWFYKIQENERNDIVKGNQPKKVLNNTAKMQAKEKKKNIDNKIKNIRAKKILPKEPVELQEALYAIRESKDEINEPPAYDATEMEVVEEKITDVTENYNPYELEESIINVGTAIASFMGAKIEKVNSIDDDYDYKEEPLPKSFPGDEQFAESIKTINKESGLNMITTFIDSLQAIKQHFSNIYEDFKEYLFNSLTNVQSGGNPNYNENMLLALIEITNKIQESGYNNETDIGIIVLFYFLKYDINFKDNFVKLCGLEGDIILFFEDGYAFLQTTYQTKFQTEANSHINFETFKSVIYEYYYEDNISFILDASVEYYKFINIVINAYFTKILLESYENVLNEKVEDKKITNENILTKIIDYVEIGENGEIIKNENIYFCDDVAIDLLVTIGEKLGKFDTDESAMEVENDNPQPLSIYIPMEEEVVSPNNKGQGNNDQNNLPSTISFNSSPGSPVDSQPGSPVSITRNITNIVEQSQLNKFQITGGKPTTQNKNVSKQPKNVTAEKPNKPSMKISRKKDQPSSSILDKGIYKGLAFEATLTSKEGKDKPKLKISINTDLTIIKYHNYLITTIIRGIILKSGAFDYIMSKMNENPSGVITQDLISAKIIKYLNANMNETDLSKQIFNLQLKLINVFDKFKASEITTSIGGNTPDTNLNEGYQKILRKQKPVNPGGFVDMIDKADVRETRGVKSTNKLETISRNYYTINNAATLSDLDIFKKPKPNSIYANFNNIFTKNNLIDSVFCPQTSIIDAMSNCSFSSKEINKLFGLMNFSIVNAENDASSYGGIVNYKKKEKVCVINLNLQIFGKSSVNINQNVALGASEAPLTAHIVYNKVCYELQDIFNKNKQHVKTIKDLWQSVKYNYYGDVGDNPMENSKNWNKICGAILVKSCGDFLQEINGVTKNGSYKTPPEIQLATKAKKTNSSARYDILPYDKNGNAFRLSLQGDRPSAFRSIFLLQQGSKEGINELAIAGYFSGNASFLAWRNGLIYLPDPKSGQAGGKKYTIKKRFKRYRQRQTNKQKMRNKNKKNVTKRQFKTRHFKKRTFKK